MFFVAALVICLVIKFRFPKGKSIARIIFSIVTYKPRQRRNKGNFLNYEATCILRESVNNIN